VRKDHIEHQIYSQRDIGAKIHAAVSGAAYKIHEKNEGERLLSFFGSRAMGVGFFKNGTMLFGIGRQNNIDDGKGLWVGSNLMANWELTLNVGLFKPKEVLTQEYQACLDFISSPIQAT
jgi:hypothetical protein